MQRFEVMNGGRTVVFDGDKLASSTSRSDDSLRWVEFALYRTAGGQYVFERIGQSVVFHGIGECSVVKRNKLRFDVEDQQLEDWHVPCPECQPFDDDDLIIEKPRPYALVSEDPDAIIDAAHKLDRNKNRYLTNVTRRLIEEAAQADARIERAYRVEFIQ